MILCNSLTVKECSNFGTSTDGWVKKNNHQFHQIE